MCADVHWNDPWPQEVLLSALFLKAVDETKQNNTGYWTDEWCTTRVSLLLNFARLEHQIHKPKLIDRMRHIDLILVMLLHPVNRKEIVTRHQSDKNKHRSDLVSRLVCKGAGITKPTAEELIDVFILKGWSAESAEL